MMMVYKQQSEREKRAMEKMKTREEELLDEGGLSGSYLRLLHKKPLLGGYPLSKSCVSLQSSPEFSPSSSSFSKGFCSYGFCSFEDGSGSPYATAPPPPPPLFEEAKFHQSPSYLYFNGLSLDDSKSPHNINGLSQGFVRMNIGEDHNVGAKMKGFETDPRDDGFGFGFGNAGTDGSLGGGFVPYNVKNHSSYGGFNNGDFSSGGFDMENFQSSPHGVSLRCDDVMRCRFNRFEKGGFDSVESFLAHNHQSDDLCSGSGWYKNQRDYLLEQRKELGRTWSNEGTHQLQNPFSTRPYINDALVGPQQYTMDSNGGRDVMDPLGSPQLNGHDPLCKSLLLKRRTRSSTNNGIPQSLISTEGAGDRESLWSEDSFIIQGGGLNHRGHDSLRDHKKNHSNAIAVRNLRGKSIRPGDCFLPGGTCENGQKLSSYNALAMAPSTSSLNEFQGYIHLMAQDQNGCLFLQKIFEEGTSQDIDLIFDEIIDHVVELMLKPFGNYVVQKLLDVCDEKHRWLIVRMVTYEPRQLVRICLNTYGTRVVQRLIETLTTRQQIASVILALKPGVLDLVKDQNGNHVIQRCLNLLSNEDNKFIFDAATKFCVEIATHRHGCCVMQRCIARATGKHREKLMTEISKNGLLLAQDPFGNYVVQYVMDLKSPRCSAILLSQFEGNYVHLSTQKFGSHVVERCLGHFEESRLQIVLELVSVPYFEQLLQDPFANYVIQCALAVTKGALHSSLVEAIRPHMMLRTSPYCKRIFSRNLLKK